MARVELPESRLRMRRRRVRIRIALLVLGAFVVVSGLLVGAAYLPFLQLQAVTVSGAQTIATSTIGTFVQERLAGTYWFVLPKSNIFLYPRQQINADLRAFYPMLASADVRFAPAAVFQNLSVTVVEREPRALWCPSTTPGPAALCYFMDESGVVYAPAPSFSSPVYVPYFGGQSAALPWQYMSAQQFIALGALVDAIVRKIPQEQLGGVSVDTVGDVRMNFASGFILLFALDDAGGDIFERFTLALTAEPLTARQLSDFEYLDLRFGDKLYYKLKVKP